MTDDNKTDELDIKLPQKLALREGTTLSDVMSDWFALRDKALATLNNELDLPVQQELAPEEIYAMEQVQSLMADMQLPDSAREATEAERAWMIALRSNVSIVEAAVKRIKEKQIRRAAHIHFDRVAEREGRVTPETIRNSDGHYVIEDKGSFRVPEAHQTIVRTYKRGSATFGEPEISGDELLRLYDEGVITRAEYLRWTRATRVLRPDQILEEGQKDPRVFDIIARITKTSAPSVSIGMANVSDDEAK